MSNYTELEQRVTVLLDKLNAATAAKKIIDENKQRITDNNKTFIDDHDSYNEKKDKHDLFVGNILAEASKITSFNNALSTFISDLEAFETHFVIKGSRYVVDKEIEVINEYDNKIHPSDNDLGETIKKIEKISTKDTLIYLMSPRKSKGVRRTN